jgi:CBS domain-containing protein
MEGRTAGRCRAIDVARTDVMTVTPDRRLRDLRDEMADAESDICLVVDERGVLLGRVDGMPADAGDDSVIGDVMRLAPGTVKPDTFLRDLVDDLRGTRFKRTILTAREPHEAGRFLGVLFLTDVERVLAENERL